MMTHPALPTDSDIQRKEIAVLSIELLARDLRASTLSSASRHARNAQLAADGRRPGRSGRRGARRAIGTYLIHLGTAIAGPSPDGRSPRPVDRPA